MHVERHIFGSFSGYTTLARSPGVSADDCRTLESGAFGFGQLQDARFARGLGRHPAYFTRLLAGNRRGLTRVLEGNPDDNNRPTLMLVTAIVSQHDWDSLLWGDVKRLLDTPALWAWDGQANLPPLELEPPLPSQSVARRAVPKLLALVSELERQMAGRSGVVVSADDFNLGDLRAIEMLIPPVARRGFTSAYRSLSPRLQVTLNCIAAESGGEPTFRYQAGAVPLSPYAQFLSASDLDRGVIPMDKVAAYRGFAMSPEPQAAEAVPPAPVLCRSVPGAPLRGAQRTAEPASRSGGSWAVAAALVVVGLLVGTLAGWNVGAGRTLKVQQAAQERQRRELETASADAMANHDHAFDEELSKALGVKAGPRIQMLQAARAKMDEADKLAKAVAAAKAVVAAKADPPKPSPANPNPANPDAAKPGPAQTDPPTTTTPPAPPPKAPGDAAQQAAAAHQEVVRQRDELKQFYDDEFKRQAEQFETIKRDLLAVLKQDNALVLSRSLPRIRQIADTLTAFRTNWPLTPEKDKQWVAELNRLERRCVDVLQALEPADRARSALERADQALDRLYSKKPGDKDLLMEEARRSLDEADAAIQGLPPEVVGTKIAMGPLRKMILDRLKKTREDLTAYDKRRNGAPEDSGPRR
jgi:hypothetical protein